MGLDDPQAQIVPGCGPLRAAPLDAPLPLRQQIYESVRAAGRISRTALARDLQVSPGSVSPLVSELIGRNLLREVEDPGAPPPSGRGRPPVTLGVEPAAGLVVGLRLSDDGHTGVVVDMAGRPVASAELPRRGADRSPRALLDEAAKLTARLICDIDATRILGAGIGLPGLIESGTGRMRWSPILDERDVALAPLLSDRLGLPVAIDNDANVLTMAELWFGRGRSLPDFAVVTIEGGVGMGLVIGHTPWRGGGGLGMELGHSKVQIDGALCRCGARGCLEAYVADYALVREAAVALNGPLPPRGEVLGELDAQARAGNPAARAIFDRAGRYLALALANVATLFDPSRIILSGSRMREDYLYADAMPAEIAALSLGAPPPVEINAWDGHVWARGAAALALDRATPKLLG
ncbi:ROK family protein [Jannaschia aquimarina]|uniref:NagC protein n=1 Tax=Jannaschia aquimarina TaxID=935700 RepID=A0A0D1DA24_9RHOB|nr:ROK family protein [Jannaschia aquimarina]KIT16743.1 N-acetylglucosamine repressor [Jannaschia aquimarina]SNS53424.1 Sugar kinase of the NBD/HSP70 family, may contain an N-terminal HTH domain [Jannaschia aquimarina]